MNNLIKSSLEYYDLKYSTLLKKLSITINDTIERNDSGLDLKDNLFLIKDSKNKSIFKSKYEILCKIDDLNNIITWSWALPEITKNKSYISRQLLNYGLDLSDNNLNELKSILVNSKIKYENFNSLNILLKIFIFLTKKEGYKIYDNNVYVFFNIEN